MTFSTEDDWPEQPQDPVVEILKPDSQMQATSNDLEIPPEQEVIICCRTHCGGAWIVFLLCLMCFEIERRYDDLGPDGAIVLTYPQ